MWTVAASGHVDEGETWDVAAYRETVEEIGIVTKLTPVGTFILKEDVDTKKIRRVIHVYEGTIDSSQQIKVDYGEVADVKWFELDDLKLLMTKNPD